MTKHKVPNIVRGGVAIPLKGKTNYYYMAGRKHKDGGIDIGDNPRTGLEVEDGEVMHITDNATTVYSAQKFLGGKSPAERVMSGENPERVFNAQEEYKRRNKINDDGTRKKGEWGMKEGSTADVITDMIPVVGTLKEATRFVRNPSWEQAGWTIASLASDITGGLVGKVITKAAKSAKAARATGKRARSISPTFAKGTGAAVTSTGDFGINSIQSDIEKNKKSMEGMKRRNSNDSLRTELKTVSKYKNGGLYSVTSNGKTRLYQFPSTGGVQTSTTTRIAKSAKRTKYKTGGDKETDEKFTVNNVPEFISLEQTLPPTPFDSADTEETSNVPRAFAKRNRDITDPEELDIAYQKASGTYPNWFRRTYNTARQYTKDNPETVGDVIGLASNLVGAGVSYRLNRKMLDKLKYSSQPIARQATKLKTRININPQLDKMRESLAEYERSVRNNTASSRVALARQQRARLRNIMQANELYAAKENQETALINKDRLNQQSVRNANIDAYNRWVENKAAFENAIVEKKAENKVALLDTINAGVQNIINVRDKRSSDRQTRLAMMAAYPNVNPRILRDLGIRGITDKDIDNWDKAYGKRKKGSKKNDD